MIQFLMNRQCRYNLLRKCRILNESPENRAVANRLLVGLLSIASVFAGLTVAIVSGTDNIWCGSFLRSGLLLAALWLAMPTRGRAAAWEKVSPWTIVASAAVMFIVLRNPRVFLPLAIAVGGIIGTLNLLTRRLR